MFAILHAMLVLGLNKPCIDRKTHMQPVYQYIALGRYTQHVYVGVSGRYSRNRVDFLPGCTDKLPQAFTKQRVCIGTDQEQHSILFSLAEELHTALFRLKA
jgi:hypothetical protein